MPVIGRIVTFFWCFAVFGACGENSLPVKGKSDGHVCNLKAVDFSQCKLNEACVSTNGSTFCRCRKDFERKEDGTCQLVPTEPNPSAAPDSLNSSSAGGFGLGLLLWLFMPVLVAAVFGVVVYFGRQKMWLNRFYRMRVRSYNNVLRTRPV